MRLVLSRAAAGRTLLVAAALAAVVTTVLLTGFVLYAQLLPVAGVRAAVLDAPAEERTLVLIASAGQNPDELAARDAAVRELLARGLGGVPLEVSAGGYASSQGLPPGLTEDEDAFALVAFLEGVSDHAALVDGEWPAPAPNSAPAGEPVQAALPAAVAAGLGVEVGDELTIVDARGTEQVPARVVVVGLWERTEAADPYWQLASAPLGRGGLGPFVVHVDDFVARYQQLAITEWLAVPDAAQLAEARKSGVRDDYDALAAEVVERREADPVLGSSARLRSGLPDLTARLDVALVVNRSGMVLPAALLVVISGFGLVLVARLLAAHRRGENALLRARGASRRQLVRFTATEAVLVVAPAGLLGGPLGTRLVGLADDRAGELRFGLAGDLAGYGLLGPPQAWAAAVVATAGCALALAVPAAGRGRTWVAEQQERSRPGRAAVLQRAGVDVALVALAALAWTQLRRYGTAVTPTDAGFGIDPLLVAAPVVGVLAATALALRLLPVATRLGVRLAGRSDSFPGLLGMWQADRRPHAGPVLLLVLAVATAVLAPAVASTWQQSQRDQAAQRVGADLRIIVANPFASSRTELVGALPETATAMPVHRTDLGLPEGGDTTLLALDAERAARVALVRPDLSAAPTAELFGALQAGRPVIEGAALPEGALRLVGRFRFVSPGPVVRTFTAPEFFGPDAETFEVEMELPEPEPSQLTVHVMDADGVIRSVRVGRLDADPSGTLTPGRGVALDQVGGLDIDVALPPDTTALVGLGAGVRTTGFDFGLAPPPGADPIPVSWHWEDLRVVDADGVEVPLELPDTWGVHVPGPQDSGPSPERVGPDLTVTASLLPDRDYPVSLQLLLTAPVPDLSVVPAVVTPDVLEATGSDLGAVLGLASDVAGPGELPALRAVAVIDAVPGTVDGSGVLVDLGWLSTHQLLQGRRLPAPTEWWASTPAAGSTAGELSWVAAVEDRRVEARELLDDPLGSGVLFALWTAAAAAATLAAFGLVVDSRATAVRRRRELAVLHTLGAAPRALARALVVEQAVLAGLGVVAGVLVGVGVSGAMGTSLVLTPAGDVPVPVPLLTLAPAQFAAPTLGLFVVAVVLGALVARRARREVAAGALRIGED